MFLRVARLTAANATVAADFLCGSRGVVFILALVLAFTLVLAAALGCTCRRARNI